ncbi:hypothetical protein ABMA27_010429 [Loxostege sticticalis]|uniref:Reverse transcriptase domain-containing protein n=1 Tax=Loxostege sticticalis TaxID=481309 RepID=A0ABR3H5Q2_LOXSC
MLKEAALVKAWLPVPSGEVEVDEEAEWFREALTHVCDASMPRSGALPPRRRPTDSPSAYRPIVLLDEIGKLFERIISVRLVRHLEGTGPGLSEFQFGFRAGRSTIDALLRLRELAESAVSRGEVLLAVSLDIANAFNTLPWASIRRALEYHGVPAYLQAVIADYLNDREVMCVTPRGVVRRQSS